MRTAWRLGVEDWILFRTSPEFERHSENLAAIGRGLTQIERAHKHAIRRNDSAAVETLARLHTLMLGVMAEARLRKIVADPNGFNERERQLIWRVNTQVGRWLEAVELAFRRHYSVLTHLAVDESSLGAPVFARFQEVRGLLSGDLQPVIEDRNKDAHGQWVWRLKSRKENEFQSDRAPLPLNYCAIESRRRVIVVIGELVHLLVVSQPGFDRHYAALMKRLDESRPRLQGAEYPQFVNQLRASKIN
ncbi:hypothetical protein [Micromonospora sp. NPDC048830]|uniref:hypothetical protein n=1 Tax=Micromonospora sp. NPDC048830 TaxID=3364257 RepID=UPI003719179A